MATIANAHESTFTDGSGPTGDILNINTADGQIEIPNGKTLKFYSDAYTTLTGQIINGNFAPAQSATAVAIANSGTIATANIGVSRLNPASNVTGIIMAVGTLVGQQCWVVNESAYSITMAASGTSHVADGVNDIIAPLQARLYVWDSSTSLWYGCAHTNAGTLVAVQSTTAVALGAAGTVATANIGVSRLNPAAARTSCIMAVGTQPGQLVLVVNEATVEKYVQMDVSGTSNVADGINCVIPGLSAKLFIWDSGTSLWYEIPLTVNGTINLAQSSAAAATATSGTITTNGVGIARVSPASAITGVILQAGLFPGQQVIVVNEAVATNSVTFDASGTSNVADGVNNIIAGLQSRLFTWDSGTSLWYANSVLNNGTIDLVQSATAVATGAAGTIATAGIGVSRINPAAARTLCVMQAGTIPGQLCLVVNEAAFANSVQMDVAATSNVASGGNCVIPGQSSRLFVWDSGTSRWYDFNLSKLVQNSSQILTLNDGTNDVFNVNATNKRVELVNNTLLRIYSDSGYTTRSVEISGGTVSLLQSTSAAATAGSGTITTAGVGVARVSPAGNITGVILQAGTLPGQKVTVINESAFSVTFAASGTSNVADGTGDVIATLTAATFTWDGGTSLWYRG
jgi:hypothetical protein